MPIEYKIAQGYVALFVVDVYKTVEDESVPEKVQEIKFQTES